MLLCIKVIPIFCFTWLTNIYCCFCYYLFIHLVDQHTVDVGYATKIIVIVVSIAFKITEFKKAEYLAYNKFKYIILYTVKEKV
jgi:hypothetical protein